MAGKRTDSSSIAMPHRNTFRYTYAMLEVARHKKMPWGRTLLLILGVLSLHALMIDWGGRYLGWRESAKMDPATISVTLRPLPPAQPVSLPVAQKAPPRPTLKRSPAPASAPRPAAPPPAIAPIPDSAADQSATPETNGPTSNSDGSGNASDGQGEAKPPSSISAEDAPPPAGTHYETNPPPTVTLEYDVQATYNQMPVHGSGTIAWKTDGKTYRIDGKAEDFFFTFLNFSSTGDINEFGVAPELYTEKRMRKSATNTHFHRERNTISFSASTQTYPRVGGEQDRASLIWQLSAIGRKDSAKYVIGAVIDLFVAGARDAEIWRIQVLGAEQISVPIGDLQTWHVVRMPNPGSHDQRIDIWLAPEHEWYPVRLRYSDPNGGDYLDMALKKLEKPVN
ncbi:DUF3108 domain-containing protein [Herbaspirillum lusitanum]|uniref:DUF3108 domain-containing protein n=1 Tax=Herbaspirillum lusitanum TaxID=213312 RepID=A0ABW9ADJ2_9BURK